MWVLNSAALRHVGADDSDTGGTDIGGPDIGGIDTGGIERDDRGGPTGRLLRMDGWPRDRLPSAPPADWPPGGPAGHGPPCAPLRPAGVTDATPRRGPADRDACGPL